MRIGITKSIIKSLNYGIKPDMLYSDSQKIYIYNILSLVAFSLQISFAFFYLLHGKFDSFLINIVQFSIFLLGYLSISISALKFVRSVIIFFSSLITIYSAFIHNNGVEFMLLPVIVFALIVYDSIWLFIIHTILSLSALIYFRIQQPNNYTSSNIFITQNVYFITSIFCLIIILFFYKRIYDKQHIEIETRNKLMNLQNIQISKGEYWFRSLIENSVDGISVLNKSYNAIYRSPVVTKLVGWNDEEMRSKSLRSLAHPEDIDKLTGAIEMAISNPNNPIPLTYRSLHKNGNYIWLSGFFTNIVFENNENTIVINFRDVTNQKLIEQELHKSELLFRTIFENVVEGIALVDKNFDPIIRNQAAIKLLGDPNINKGSEILHPEDKDIVRNKQNEALNNPGKRVSFEGRFLNPEGSYYILEGELLNLLQTNGVNAIISNYRNITRRKELEIQQNELSIDLASRNLDLEKFSYILSHNIRAPLSNILGLNAALLKEKTEGNIRNFIELIAESTNNLDAVVKDVSKILQLRNSISDENELINLEYLLDEIIKDQYELINKKSAVLNINFKTVAHYYSVKIRLKSIFVELIQNALKYSKNETKPCIEIRSALEENSIKIYIKDYGIGIDIKRYQSSIFGLYKKFNYQKDGKGFGLYLVKTQVDKLNGQIQVKSEIGQWTEFIISLPLNIE
jgi:PAS domain S-box-containing protein